MSDAVSGIGPSRRSVITMAATGALAALAACDSDSNSGRSTSGSTSSRSAASAEEKSNGALPDKQAVLARFGRRKPRAWNLNLPGEIVSVPSTGKAIAVTFDACGGPGGSGYDEKLIELLRAHKVKATLNFNSRWIKENRSAAEELAKDPLFHIANHGYRHQPLSVSGRSAYGIKGTANLSALYDEVTSAHDWIAEHCPGQRILFRSGTAYSDDVGVDVCRFVGMPFLGYSVNGDGGTTFTPAQVHQALLSVKAGDVVISHMNHPERGTRPGYAEALPQLIDHGFTFTHLPTA